MTGENAGTVGIKLSGELKPEAKSSRSIYITIDDRGKTETIFSGIWDGFLLRGAIRNIELEYRNFKREAKREALSKISQKNIKNQEAIT